MGSEVERKFLLSEPPPELAHPSVSIAQRYLVIGADGLEVRLRRRGTATLMTIKHGVGLVRREEEFEIDAASFQRLWGMCDGTTIDKQRYRVAADDVIVEVDVYRGALEGLLTAEVEFASEQEASAYTPAAWLGREVTGDPRYANQQLAMVGLPPREEQQA